MICDDKHTNTHEHTMTKPNVLGQQSLTIAEVAEDLAAIKKRDVNLTFRGGKVEEYVKQFSKLNTKKVHELREKLNALNVPRLKDVHINKIIDIMPKHLEELKVILQAYTITIKDDQLKTILDTVAPYA